MFEMALLRPSKETENKLRWSTYVESDQTEFHLYIPKWRVPEPWPGRILVGIQPYNGNPEDFVSQTGSLEASEEPIFALLQPVVEHTRTIRYAPVVDKEEWQTGEPYIPYSLIPPDSHFLSLKVQWDIESKGLFIDVPTYRDE